MQGPDKIRVLHLRSCRGGGGGPEKTILYGAKAIDTQRFEVHIAYLKSRDDPDFDLDKRAEALGIERFTAIPEDHKFDRHSIRTLLDIIKRNKIDILSTHCYKSDLYALLLARQTPIKLIATAHGPLASFRHFWSGQNWRVRYLYDQLDLLLLRRFDQVIIVSESMRRAVCRYGVPSDKILWVKNAIDARHFRQRPDRRNELRSRFGIPPDVKVIGAVGRLNAEKDYPNFLQAVQQLVARRDDLHFVIAGSGPLEQRLKQDAEKRGISGHVQFLGHFHDVREVYDLLDLYVLSSTREGLPNTVLEAMAMQVPIVATDVDGVGETVSDGREALLVPPRDPTRLAAAITRLLDDPCLAASLADAARVRVVQAFSFEARIREVERLYRRLLGIAEPEIAEPQLLSVEEGSDLVTTAPSRST